MIKKVSKSIVGIVIALAAFFLLSTPTQAQGTISDFGDYVSFEYSNGDTISIYKDNVVSISSNEDDYVYVWGNDSRGSRRALMELTADDFSSFSNTYDLRKRLEALFFGYDYTTYSNIVGSQNIDSVKYYDITATDTVLLFLEVFTFSGDTIQTKTILTQ